MQYLSSSDDLLSVSECCRCFCSVSCDDSLWHSLLTRFMAQYNSLDSNLPCRYQFLLARDTARHNRGASASAAGLCVSPVGWKRKFFELKCFVDLEYHQPAGPAMIEKMVAKLMADRKEGEKQEKRKGWRKKLTASLSRKKKADEGDKDASYTVLLMGTYSSPPQKESKSLICLNRD